MGNGGDGLRALRWVKRARHRSCVRCDARAILWLESCFAVLTGHPAGRPMAVCDRRRCGDAASCWPFTCCSRVAGARLSAPPQRIRSDERPVGAGAGPATELEAILEPMLSAIVRLAGANAGTVRVIGAGGTCFETVVSVGIPGSKTGAGAEALAAWCNTCAESRDPSSECVRNELCGHDERFPTDVLGPVCNHIVAVPLRHRDHPVGTLNLMFEAERRVVPCHDAAPPGHRRPPRHDARERTPRAREPAHPPHRTNGNRWPTKSTIRWRRGSPTCGCG